MIKTSFLAQMVNETLGKTWEKQTQKNVVFYWAKSTQATDSLGLTH